MNMIIFLLALAPILWLVIALSLLKLPAFKACPIALAIAIVLSMTFFKMPAVNCLTGGLEGIALALWPISLVILAGCPYFRNIFCGTGAFGRSFSWGRASGDHRFHLFHGNYHRCCEEMV